jgi:acetolactate synthase-1/2/3 large subunit
MAGKPAVTLLHLGPGLANGLANLHNARRAASPVINMVGDHATYHLHYNAPLTSDAAGVARPMSDWVRVAHSPRDLAQAGAEAHLAAMTYPGQVATVIVPADHAWNEGSAPVAPRMLPASPRAPAEAVAEAAEALRHAEGPCALFLGGRRCGLMRSIWRAGLRRRPGRSWLPRHSRRGWNGAQAGLRSSVCPISRAGRRLSRRLPDYRLLRV